MISFMLSQVRLSVTGSRARYFQKLFTSGTLRVFFMSSYTARTCGDASLYSIGGVVVIQSSSQQKTDLDIVIAGAGHAIHDDLRQKQHALAGQTPGERTHANDTGLFRSQDNCHYGSRK